MAQTSLSACRSCRAVVINLATCASPQGLKLAPEMRCGQTMAALPDNLQCQRPCPSRKPSPPSTPLAAPAAAGVWRCVRRMCCRWRCRARGCPAGGRSRRCCTMCRAVRGVRCVPCTARLMRSRWCGGEASTGRRLLGANLWVLLASSAHTTLICSYQIRSKPAPHGLSLLQDSGGGFDAGAHNAGQRWAQGVRCS